MRRLNRDPGAGSKRIWPRLKEGNLKTKTPAVYTAGVYEIRQSQRSLALFFA